MGTCALKTQIHADDKENSYYKQSSPKNNFKNDKNITEINNLNQSIDDVDILDDLDLPLTSNVMYNSLATSPSAIYAKSSIKIEELPTPGTPESIYSCSIRLLCLIKWIKSDKVTKEDLLSNINYAILVLESAYVEEAKRICEEDDELPSQANGAVPEEVREWLSNTFTRRTSSTAGATDKPKFRSVANAIRAGILVERIYRRMSSSAGLTIPPNVLILMKAGLDTWNFDVFEVNEASDSHSLKYVGYELFHKYNLINKFKIDSVVLENLLHKLEEGYAKFNNPYHNFTHAADVAQTCHIIISQSGLSNWMTDIEILAVLFAAMIHDFEHTGTTNGFHVNSNSELALLYNDRGVLENHHVSSVYRIMENDSYKVMANLKKEEFREIRSLVIEIVLNTDMSLHFQQLKNMKTLLAVPENIEKSKGYSLLVHCADISHPTKSWILHEKWTDMLVEEFFRQGDREKEMGLPISPLCDRNATVVAQSQIGFIDFIVEPSFTILGDMLDRMLQIATCQNENSTNIEETNNIDRPWVQYIHQNKDQWKSRAPPKT